MTGFSSNMLSSKLAALALACLSTLAHAEKHSLFVGTFASKNLYSLEFDDKALTLDLVSNFSVPVPSSYIAWNHDKTRLYGTDYEYRGATKNGTEPPVFVSYAVESATSIKFDGALSGGKDCNGSAIFILADPNPPYNVYATDYWGVPGCGTVFSVTTDGALDEAIQDFEYEEEGSSVHGLALSPDSRILYSADTHGNKLWTHSISPRTGKVKKVLGLQEGPSPGANPRHVISHPNGKVVYAATEAGNQVVWYKVECPSKLPVMQDEVYSLLPEGAVNEDYWGDTLALSHSGKYLWATTRAHDEGVQGFISVFDVDEHGAIKRQNFVTPTTASGGVANAITPSDFDDRFAALTDNELGFVEIWALEEDGMSAEPVARIDMADQGNDRYASGCCANAVWFS